MQEPLAFLADEEPEPRTPKAIETDAGLETVAWWLTGRQDFEELFGTALRRAIDEVIDGHRTRRYSVRQLEKTEKTYIGTKVEIVVGATFSLPKGGPKKMDYIIAGQQVDAKFSLSPWGWTIPREAMGHLCLVIHADDETSFFKVGLVRITEDILTERGNQDGKRSIAKEGRSRIRWLIPDGRLPVNALLHMDPTGREEILAAGSGQARIDKLFALVQGRIVNRETVVTVGAQTDAAKRVRDARIHLCPRGIVVLGHQENHPYIARALGLPVPNKGEWISARLVPARDDERPTVLMDNRRFVLARADEAEHPVSARY